MAENVVINGTTYPAVEAVSLADGNGNTTVFYPDAVRYNEQYLTEAQKAQARQNLGVGSVDEVAEEVLARLGTPVFGTVDANKVITLTGALTDGTYTFQYEDEEGNTHPLGTYTKAPEVINWIKESINADKTQYVGSKGEDGYTTGVRINTSGAESTSSATAFSSSGFIKVNLNDELFIYNMTMRVGSTDDSSCVIVGYDDSFTYKVRASLQTLANSFENYTTGDNNQLVSLKIDTSKVSTWANITYIRLSWRTVSGAEPIVTINQQMT